LEEARLFGGDTAAIARALAPLYQSIGDFRALVVLPKSPLSRAEQRRAAWLATHPQVLEFADSVATITYAASIDGRGIGVTRIRVGERRIDAVIDPRVSGVVLRGKRSRWADEIRLFGDDSSGEVAVIPELHLGGVTLSNVPARVDIAINEAPVAARETGGTGETGETGDAQSVLGLDVLRGRTPHADSF
jgi:hypothetical protein